MAGKIPALTVNRDQPIALKCRPALLLQIGMLYEIIRTEDKPERGPWRAASGPADERSSASPRMTCTPGYRLLRPALVGGSESEKRAKRGPHRYNYHTVEVR